MLKYRHRGRWACRKNSTCDSSGSTRHGIFNVFPASFITDSCNRDLFAFTKSGRIAKITRQAGLAAPERLILCLCLFVLNVLPAVPAVFPENEFLRCIFLVLRSRIIFIFTAGALQKYYILHLRPPCTSPVSVFDVFRRSPNHGHASPFFTLQRHKNIACGLWSPAEKLYPRYLQDISRTAYCRLWQFHSPLCPATETYFRYPIALLKVLRRTPQPAYATLRFILLSP